MTLAGTAMVDFICLSIASRFIFTSFSADGQAIWLMKTAPEGWIRFMRSKLLVFGLPTGFFALLLMLLSGKILDLSFPQLLTVGLHCFWDSVVLVLLAMALGMLFINPSVENPLKLVVSPGGVLLMTSGFFITGLHVFLRLSEAVPALNVMLMKIGWPDVQDGRATYYYSGLIFLEAIGLFYLIRRGVEHLRKGDFS